MTPEEHNKTLATLHFIYGGIHGLTLVALALLFIVASVVPPQSLSISGFWFKLGVVAFFVVLFAVVLLPLVAGYGLRKRERWAKPVTIASGIISLINVPIGTALGIYAITFFRSEAGSTLYGGSGGTSEVELQEAFSRNKLGNLADRLN